MKTKKAETKKPSWKQRALAAEAKLIAYEARKGTYYADVAILNHDDTPYPVMLDKTMGVGDVYNFTHKVEVKVDDNVAVHKRIFAFKVKAIRWVETPPPLAKALA